ncbi:BON domain-containing protein [Actinoplanes sp. TRM 88003]|uniref:BON domain-containing protein n=1 Tax=Paractinoplanes aksuensis TaxID=2939490 RepID=A0ABT1E3F4_9ACTN|nr:BON domain-containing protein [Actinoplanes aksuensis]MCO8277654.1 BON domain-containing protein [Actinoplanes aksuensis]
MMPLEPDPDDRWVYPIITPSHETIEADIRIADAAAVALGCDARMRGRHLEVLVQNRVVVLLGEVESEQVRVAAAVVAWAVPEVFDVSNQLTVTRQPDDPAT